MGLKHLLLALVAHQALATIVPREEMEHAKRQSATITVNVGTTYQSMDGFGFSEAFGFVGGVYSLPATQQKQCLDLLFSTTAGAGLNIVRNRIGSTSSDSIEPNSPGSPSATPKYVGLPNSDSNQLWFSQKAQGYGVTTFYADAWSAPGYMKTNGNEANGGYLCGVTGETCSSGDWKQAYANYIVQYLKDYQAAGVDVTYVGFLNEPEYAPTYSSMLSDGTKAASFINVLYPTLQSSGLKTKIACCDAEGWNDQKTFTGQLISAGVESKLGLITSHAYTSQPNGAISTDLHVWQTEYADLDGTGTTAWYSSGAMGEGMTWANYIYTAVVNSGVSGYLHWIGSQSGNSNSALVPIVNNAPVATGRLWAFGQWSRYVRPGAVRVATSGGTSTLLTSAFKNPDGTLSVQFINNGNSAVTVTVAPSGYTASSVTAYVSSNSNNNIATMSASISGGHASGSIPSRSMVTFVLSGSGSTSPPGGTTTTSSPPSGGTTTTTPPSTTTSSAPSGAQTQYGQCGGTGWTGPTTCVSPYTCKYSNPYYSQCV